MAGVEKSDIQSETQKCGGNHEIKGNADDIDGGRYKRSGSDSRVNMNTRKSHGNQ